MGDAVEGLRPIGEVAQVVGSLNIRAALGPVGVLLRKGIVDPRHRRRLTEIAVPGDAVDVLVDAGEAQLANRAAPQIVIVVNHPDFGREACLAQNGAEVALDKLGLIFLTPQTGGHIAVLVGVDFILHGDGIDPHALCLVSFKEFTKVVGVWPEAVLAHRPAQHGAVGLHPSRRRPRRGEEKEFGIHLARLKQCGQNVGFVVVDGEFLQLRIGLRTLVKAVGGARIVAGADAGAADVQRHLAGGEELVHQFVALRLRNLA